MEAHLQMSWSEALLLRGDLTQAKQQLERALWLEEKDHPEGLGVTALLLRLGNVAERQDNLDEADRLYRRAYDLLLRAAPGSGGEAAAANNLAVITGRRGDLAQAELYAARALAIREKLTPSGDAIIPSLLNYGDHSLCPRRLRRRRGHFPTRQEDPRKSPARKRGIGNDAAQSRRDRQRAR